jgi:cytochrome c peroxidase
MALLIPVLFAVMCGTTDRVPLGLDVFMPVPAQSPLTVEGIGLGRRLFFDRRLSRDGSIACATCHDPNHGFADERPQASGIYGRKGARNAPALINRGYGAFFFWDGRARGLEEQVLQPILNPDEMDLPLEEAEQRTGLSRAEMARALASYVRSIRSGDSRTDRFVGGETASLSELEISGLQLFRGKANCVACHLGPSFTDESFHNTGVAWREGRLSDVGRATVTGSVAHRGAFKTPTLREVAGTAPYMHDGSLATLEDVVAFYDRGGNPNPQLDPELRPLHLTPNEKTALIAFLRSLSGRINEGCSP